MTEGIITGAPWSVVALGVLGCVVCLAFVPLVRIATRRKER